MPTSFRCAGATGAAPTTVFFGAKLPDIINMLTPMHWGTAIQFQPDALVPANFGNLFTPFNTVYNGGANAPTLTFGGFTTAPDGTSTAQQYVEDSTTNPHFATAGYVGNHAFSPGKIRFAAFLKAGPGRTRAMMQHTFGTNGNSSNIGVNGTQWIIDLANGVTGVAQAAFGAASNQGISQALGTQIIPYGNGWYLCIMDTLQIYTGAATNDDQRFAIYIDAGSGTGAQNTTYLGNGSNGIYVWKTNVLPVGAWGINSQMFFEDFNYSPSQVATAFDLSDTRNPGFNWYLHNTWISGFGGLNPTTGSDISVASSILTLNHQTGPAPFAQVQSAAWLGTTGSSVGAGHVSGVGTENGGFHAPLYWEALQAWNPSPNGTGTASMWTSTIESISVPNAFFPNNVPGHELDIYETYLSGVPTPITTWFDYPSTGAADPEFGHFNLLDPSRIQNWEAGVTVYNTGQRVALGGVFYQGVNPAIPANTPPPNATYWSVLSSPSANDYQLALFDVTQFHRYGALLIPCENNNRVPPYNTTGTYPIVPYQGTNVGLVVMFVDGCICGLRGVQITYGPYEFSDSFAQLTDSQTNPIFLVNGAGNNFKTDWVRVFRP